MKNRLVTVLCTMLSVSILSTSCIGSFPLFHKIHSWNEGVSDNKFVNELVFICFHIIPVYEVCYLADGLIFNSIEFWSGKSPIAKAGEKKTLKGNNGDVYCVTTTKNGYKIVDETKDEAFNLNFDENTQTWSAEINGSSYKLATMNEDGTITMNLRNGETLTVNPNMQGIDMARNAVENRAYISDFAMN